MVSPGGSPGIYGVVHFKNRAIGVIPLDEAGYTYLVGQYRYPLQLYSWEIPEGGGPLDEDPLEAAKRELREETGLEGCTPANPNPKTPKPSRSNGCTSMRCTAWSSAARSPMGSRWRRCCGSS